MLKLVALGLVFFLTIALTMSLLQDRTIFPTHLVGQPGPLPAGSQRLSIDTPDGDRLHGVHIGPREARPQRTLVVGFGGNGWNGQDVAAYLHQVYPGAHVVAFHYRGYRPSTGSPSAKALLADAPLVLDAAVERVKPEQTVAVGFSIGSAVAASLAKRRELDGLILVTPFDSLKAVAEGFYPWLPVGMLFRHEMNAVEGLEASDVPVALIAGERDDLIPPARTAALRARVPNLVFDETIASAGHNDIYQRPEFRQAMVGALGKFHPRQPSP
jgi:pimeloyl-ACP methyl ester carboxylesterase